MTRFAGRMGAQQDAAQQRPDDVQAQNVRARGAHRLYGGVPAAALHQQDHHAGRARSWPAKDGRSPGGRADVSKAANASRWCACQAKWLKAAFEEMDASSETVHMLISPAPPYFRLSTAGASGSSEVRAPAWWGGSGAALGRLTLRGAVALHDTSTDGLPAQHCRHRAVPVRPAAADEVRVRPGHGASPFEGTHVAQAMKQFAMVARPATA